MAAFRPESEGGRDYGPILAEAARIAGSRPEFDRILSAAREAAVAARRIRGLAGVPRADLWNQSVADMERAATDLERACRDADAPAVIAAARRLDVSCTSCHTVFRPEARRAAANHPSFPRAPSGRAERSTRVATNEWVSASVKTVEALCSAMAPDRGAMNARPRWG
jgi:hypothetical protein